ncbi:MAG TPA: BPSS1780 family membrane protein [Methylophilaceae bacterium]|nr:BPSS1780 family membrane protein [Methylophilaceae bacterium]
MSSPNLATRKLNALHGWKWLADGFAMFRRSPVIWIALLFIYLLIGMVLSTIKLIGPIVLNLLAPVFVAGFMIGCRALEKGEELEIAHLFAGFKHHTAQLITVGGIYLAGAIVVVGIIFAGSDQAVLQAMVSGQKLTPEQASAALDDGFLLTMLVGLGLMLPLVMAYWFAPVLVAFHEMSGLQAMKQSFLACLRNLLPFFIYSVIATILLVLAALPLFLGMLVMIPTMIASLYASYRDIFVVPVSEAEAAVLDADEA